MKTPPPCTGGQIGYGETNSTFKRSGFVGKFEKISRKWPPKGLRKASVSLTAASLFAPIREPIACGSCSVARTMPGKLARSGESPNHQLSIALDHVNQKWEIRRFQS